MTQKLKVVWICHFSNSFIRSKLPLSEHYEYVDNAPWITQMINQFEKFNDIELHIVAPHNGLKKKVFAFKDKNVNYYFYRNPLFNFKSKSLQKWACYFDKLLFYTPNRYLSKQIINKRLNFTPDIINLIGFENPHYSTCILNFKNIPTLISVQGIYSNPDRFKNEKEDKIRTFLERTIIKKYKYYCIGVPFFTELILRDRQDAIFFWNFFPRNIPVIPQVTMVKEYDFVFFGRITQVKGVEDLIEAMAIVKNYKTDVSLLVMGSEEPHYTALVKQKCSKLGLDSNITFIGEQKTIEELHRNAIKARFYVLAARLEGLAGSVLECMYMGLPVVTTSAGGLAYLNKDGETVLMSKPMDVPAFANNMIRLLKEPELTEKLIEDAKAFVEKEFNHYNICRRFVEQYKAVVAHSHKSEDLPQELLYKSATNDA